MHAVHVQDAALKMKHMYFMQLFTQSCFYLCRSQGRVYWRWRINILCTFVEQIFFV